MPCYLIAYDITGLKIRNALAGRLEKAGRRIQKSVFLLEKSEHSMQKLEQELHEMLEPQDSLLIVPICHHCLAEAKFYGSRPELVEII